MKIKLLIFLTWLMIFPTAVFPQTGGTFEIEKSVIASGGNSSSGGSFSVDSTSGQTALLGSPNGGTFSINSGFWSPIFTPTAASVTISGRVLLPNGGGLPRAIVSYTDALGVIRTERTSTFGFFRFQDVESGQTYIFQVSAKGFLFAPQVVTAKDNISELNFVAID